MELKKILIGLDNLKAKGNLDIDIKNIECDSRKVAKDTLFVAITGYDVDGHDFIEQAFEMGAVCCFAQKDTPVKKNQYIIRVKSVVKAMLDLAAYYIKLLDVPVIAVTGSVGKTTTKDMIASILEQKYTVLKTAGNYNTNIGMPLMIAQLTKEHDVAVLEMGMNSFGEIYNLSMSGCSYVYTFSGF